MGKRTRYRPEDLGTDHSVRFLQGTQTTVRTRFGSRSVAVSLTAGAPRPLFGVQKTSDTVHSWPPRQEDKNRDIGDPFETVKHEYESNSNREFTLRYGDNANGSTYVGPVYVDPSNGIIGSFPKALGLSDDSLRALGTTAIARTIPTNPIAGAAVFLGELKEGLPSLVGRSLYKSGLKDYRKIGDEYLNVKFGWEPIISDFKKFATVAKDHNKILKQYRRDSGRNVRRRYEFPIERETTSSTITSGPNTTVIPVFLGSYTSTDPASTFFVNGPGHTLTTETKTSSRVWFSGCYTYYLDPGTSAMDRAKRVSQEANKLLGTRLTPETLWELAPWSWAVDYVSNLGDVIHNFSAFQEDGLVLRWGYIMEESIHEVTKTIGNMQPRNGDVPSTLFETRRTIRKRRIDATPYGFGVDLGALTGSQLAILAALGISKGPRRG